ncbi:MAG: hypothetical protein KDA96_24685, partial [Planctomycetaceae bacterium]|nr:hypothetical protein [Planctomycetaceae bacterium]
MTWHDIIAMAFLNLFQRRARTILNLIGIVTGTVVLLMCAAGSSGVHHAVHLLFDQSDIVRRCLVHPTAVWEEPPEEALLVDSSVPEVRAARIRERLRREWMNRNLRTGKTSVTPEDIQSIRQLPHVVQVHPEAALGGQTPRRNSDDPLGGLLYSAPVGDDSFRRQIISGDVLHPEDRYGVLIDEYFAYQMGFRTDEELKQLVGSQLQFQYTSNTPNVGHIFNLLTETWGTLSSKQLGEKLEFLNTLTQLMQDLDLTTLSDTQKTSLRELLGTKIGEAGSAIPEVAHDPGTEVAFTVKGVFQPNPSEPGLSLFQRYFHNTEGELLAHPDLVSDLYLSQSNVKSFDAAKITVDSTSSLREVTEQIEAMGLGVDSSLFIIESIDSEIDKGAGIVALIAV